MHHEPASAVLELFVGADGESDPIKAVAAILGCSAARVRGWRRAKGSNGTGGVIPHWHQPKLIEAADRLKLDLQPGDFVTSERLKSRQVDTRSEVPSEQIRGLDNKVAAEGAAPAGVVSEPFTGSAR